MCAQVGKRRRHWTAVGGALLAIVLAAGGCGGAGSSHLDPAGRGNSASGSTLQALVAKLRAVHVTSERYLQTTNTQVQRGRRTERFHNVLIGEVGLSPDRGETFEPGSGAIPRELVIGSARYSYSSPLGRCDGGRPWILREPRSGAVLVVGGHDQVEPSRPAAPPARASLPFQALPGEHTRGGSGPFAGLINLLGTASGPVRVVGVATIDGQRATEAHGPRQPGVVARRRL